MRDIEEWRLAQRRVGLLAAAIVLAVAVAVAVSPAEAASPLQLGPDSGPASLPDASAGQVIYRRRCANCHGPLGRGRGELADRLPAPPRSFADPTYVRRVVPAEAYAVVTEGKAEVAMPPFGDTLDDEERWAAVYAALSFTYTPETLVRGREEWRRLCAACHTPQEKPLSDPDWQASRSQRDMFSAVRPGPEEHGDLAAVSEAELWSALDFVRSWGFRPLAFDDLEVDGQLVGRVVLEGDSDERPIDNQRVRVLSFAAGVPSTPVTATTRAGGVFTATDLLVGPEVIFGLTTRYGGVDYATVVTDALAAGPVELKVYETSLDVPLRAEYSSVLVSPDPGAGVLRVLELWSIVNDSRRTRVADDGAATLAFSLPADARDIAFADPRQQSAAKFDGAMLTTRAPVIPGATEVDLEYSVPYTTTERTLVRRIMLPTESWRLAVAGEGVTLEGEDVTVPPVTGDAPAAARVEARDLEAGREIVVRAGNLPAPSPGAAGGMVVAPPAVSWLGTGLVGALAAGLAAFGALMAVLFPWVGGRAAAQRRERRLTAERRGIVAALVSLEAGHRSGAVDAADYARQRARLVERALRIDRQLGSEDAET